jgi:hypothetical protein
MCEIVWYHIERATNSKIKDKEGLLEEETLQMYYKKRTELEE